MSHLDFGEGKTNENSVINTKGNPYHSMISSPKFE